MFLRGVAAAARQLAVLLPTSVLEVVYAGTGPLASLIVPLIAAAELQNVRVTFIDINETSVAAVRQLADLLDSAVHSFVVADAAIYEHGAPIHLLVVETMQRALTVEPQVAIAGNLVGQLHDLGIMVPERVRVDLCAEAPDGKSEQYIGTVMELSRDAVVQGAITAERQLVMPHVSGRLMYRTLIQTYAEHILEPRRSGLTMPEYLWDLHDIHEGEVITFWYEINQRPRLCYRRKGLAA